MCCRHFVHLLFWWNRYNVKYKYNTFQEVQRKLNGSDRRHRHLGVRKNRQFQTNQWDFITETAMLRLSTATTTSIKLRVQISTWRKFSLTRDTNPTRRKFYHLAEVVTKGAWEKEERVWTRGARMNREAAEVGKESMQKLKWNRERTNWIDQSWIKFEWICTYQGSSFTAFFVARLTAN